MKKIKNKLFVNIVSLPLLINNLYAQADAYTDGDLTMKDQFYMMIRGGFGSFAIIFMGLGGLATIIMTRQGKSSKQAPIMGVIMLLIAAYIFIMRILIISGVLGHEYLEY